MKLRDVVIGANASIFYRLDFKKIKGVYYPKTEQDVDEYLAIAREKGMSVTVKGGGSGLSGACTGGNKERFIMSTLLMNRVLSVNEQEGYVDVQPGASPDEINAILEPRGYKFYVAPSSRDIATVGGIISTDGGGNDTWVNGTMRDNTIHVKMTLYDGRKIVVDKHGVKSDDSSLENELNKMGMTLHDVASSHGTLGFVTELRVAIRPLSTVEVIGAVAHYDDATELGKAITGIIKAKSPIKYGETIVEAHPDVREDLKPPLMILQFPEDYADDLKAITDYQLLTDDEVERMKTIRIKLPKRNPHEGIQLALFEGYGLHDQSLLKMQESVEKINDLLRSHGYVPFAKYGHAPSKWYLGNNEPAYGIVMHSREIRPGGKSGREVLKAILDIVHLCDDLGITPKPEHKWPYSDKVKRARLEELRRVVGTGFNDFIFCDNCEEMLGSMV